MSKPYNHALNSVKKFGGKPEDYMKIYNFMDFSKAGFPGMKHRIVTHHSIGIYLAEIAFGETFKNSDGRIVSTRDVAEAHVFEDLGRIPTLEDWVKNLPEEPWMFGMSDKIKIVD
jgi:hypothetical protein